MVGEGVQAADPVESGAGRQRERPGGDDADPQTGERTRSEAADHVGQVGRGRAGLVEDPGDARREMLRVASGVEGGRLGERP